MNAADVAEYWRQMAKTLKSVRRILPKMSRHSISSSAAYTEKIGSKSTADMLVCLACCYCSGLGLRANSIRDVWQEFLCATK